MLRHSYYLSWILLLTCSLTFARKQQQQELVMTWPPDNPTIKLTFGPFQSMGRFAQSISFVSDVVVENLTSKAMPRASFNVSLLDGNKVRIGNGVLIVEDLNPGQSAKVQFQCTSIGVPATLTIAARNSGGVPTTARPIPIQIISVPSGASLKVDDKPVGITPIIIRVLSGTHSLELQKEGYAVATTPLDVNADEMPGGSSTITLGGLASDTVELRDGSILNGDVVSMNLESVVMSMKGNQLTIDRNKIKKIMLVERVVTHTVMGPETPTAAPAAAQQSTHP